MADNDSHLSCSVCFQTFDSSQRRPWDIGCGHSFCEQCLRQHPRSFRYCPECRARASNPHVNISLLRLVDATGGPSATGGQSSQQQQRQQLAAVRQTAPNRITSSSSSPTASQQRQVGPQQAIGSNGSSRSVLQAIQDATAAQPRINSRQGNPSGSISQLLNAGGTSSSSGVLQTVRPGELHGTLDQHRAKIAEWRTAMWLYLTPLMGVLYLLSPLDIIPDIIPLVGFLDDLLVIVYIACSIYSVLKQQGDRIRL